MSLQTFIIHRFNPNGRSPVLGYVDHVNGDRACDKAQEFFESEVLVYTAWDKATKAQKAAALRGGYLT